MLGVARTPADGSSLAVLALSGLWISAVCSARSWQGSWLSWDVTPTLLERKPEVRRGTRSDPAERRCPVPSSAGESCPVQGRTATDVRSCNPLVCLNPSANKPHLTFFGVKKCQKQNVCVCCRGHLIPLSGGKPESPWGPADNTWYIDVLITDLCFQPEFAFYPILIS